MPITHTPSSIIASDPGYARQASVKYVQGQQGVQNPPPADLQNLPVTCIVDAKIARPGETVWSVMDPTQCWINPADKDKQNALIARGDQVLAGGVSDYFYTVKMLNLSYNPGFTVVRMTDTGLTPGAVPFIDATSLRLHIGEKKVTVGFMENGGSKPRPKTYDCDRGDFLRNFAATAEKISSYTQKISAPDSASQDPQNQAPASDQPSRFGSGLSKETNDKLGHFFRLILQRNTRIQQDWMQDSFGKWLSREPEPPRPYPAGPYAEMVYLTGKRPFLPTEEISGINVITANDSSAARRIKPDEIIVQYCDSECTRDFSTRDPGDMRPLPYKEVVVKLATFEHNLDKGIEANARYGIKESVSYRPNQGWSR